MGNNRISSTIMTKTLHGKVRGKIIELEEDLSVAEGQEVEVQVRVLPKASRPAAGRLADTA